MKTEKSKELFQRAESLAPAGVHSPVRAFKSVGGHPLFFKKGNGSTLTDVDGNEFVDFCMSWGALALGHAYPTVIENIKAQAEKGTHYGTPTSWDVELAELALAALKPFDRIRFVNSGTEAVMTALRLARGVTKRDLIVKIDGAYHGHVDSLLVNAGSGLVTQGVSSSLGVPECFAKTTIVIPFGNKLALEETFQKFKDQIAAIIVEPVMANNGLFEHPGDYLAFAKELTQQNGALLIFDEVITGYRVAWGGSKEKYNVLPDIGTYGKVLGGGMPIGAIAGSREIMEQLAPLGQIYQAGTLSGNPLAMAAGVATLRAIKENALYSKLDEIGSYFDQVIQKVQKDRPDLKMHFRRVNSIFWFCFDVDALPQGPDDIKPQSAAAYKNHYHKLLESGVYLAPSAYEVGFLSIAHTKQDLDKLADAIRGL